MLCRQEMKEGVNAASGTGRRLISVILRPSDRGLGRNAFELQSSTSMWVTGMTDELKTTYIGY